MLNEQKSNCINYFLNDSEPNGIPFGSKSISQSIEVMSTSCEYIGTIINVVRPILNIMIQFFIRNHNSRNNFFKHVGFMLCQSWL